ncbi:MAG: acyl-CoA desaturase [Burkholderiaceae bacterium]
MVYLIPHIQRPSDLGIAAELFCVGAAGLPRGANVPFGPVATPRVREPHHMRVDRELVQRVMAMRLSERTHLPYLGLSLAIGVGVGASLYAVTVTDNWLFQLGNAVFLAFWLVQAGMLAHDLYHLQVFFSQRANRLCGAIMFSLCAGVCGEGWYALHSKHHVFVNNAKHDSDLDMPFIFSGHQLSEKPAAVLKCVLPVQHWLFFATLPLVYLYLKVWSLVYISKNRTPGTLLESVLIAIHTAVLVGMPFWFLPPFTAVLFLLVLGATAGIYAGTVFAPNHKGMAIVTGDQPASWQQQIVLTRNLRPGWIRFILLGAVHYQIEHHLFPSMSRFNQARIHHVVKQFCAERGLPYHECGYFSSMYAIFVALKREALLHTKGA